MTVGLMIGSLLAQDKIGPSYFMDPKVVASFVMWGVFVLLLFLRRSAGLRGRRAAYLSGAVFIAMILVWAANVISRVHSFGAQ
jgi:ABC-type transport system involved in cytochrome c biogenesis permease subunit